MFDDSLPVEQNALIHTEIKYLETVSSHTSTDEWKDAIYCETKRDLSHQCSFISVNNYIVSECLLLLF